MTVRNLNQDATYWSLSGRRGGSLIYGTPTAVKCRWEKRSEVYTRGGEDVGIGSTVYVQVQMKPGDYLYLGVSTAEDPASLSQAYRIARFDWTPSLRNDVSLGMAYL